MPAARFGRRALLLLALCLAPLSLVGPALAVAPAEATTTDLRATEERLMALINHRRDQRGIRPLRVDSRISKVARARSLDMVERNYFDHKDPDGLYAQQHLKRADIRFERVSEIIAWNHGSDINSAAADAMSLWMHSPVHRREILKEHNYFGAGLATDGHVLKWTVIFITGPDRTDPVARLSSVEPSGGSMVLKWTGSDPRLVVNTAGLKSFDVSQRVGAGDWTIIRYHTTGTVAHIGAVSGRSYGFRVRARDKAGNLGSWSAVTQVSVP